jgi:ferredoxin-NADP reductase
MWQLGKVVQVSAETARVRSFGIEVPNWKGHRPGQHMAVRITLGNGFRVIRDYSIASPPEERRPTLTVERMGKGGASSYLVDELQVGDHLEVCGPLGDNFIWEVKMGGPLLLVAGGSGIVPLMSMIRHKAAVGSDVPTCLLYSSRSLEETLYQKDLEALATVDDSLQVVHTFTKSAPAKWEGYGRRIDFKLLEELAWPPEEHPLAFVSGPTKFVGTIVALLAKLEYSTGYVRTEYFG